MRFRVWLEATKDDFWNLAYEQRGIPEKAMLRVQFIMGGGSLNPVVEHVGDIIHRMSERNTFDYAGYGLVKDKVDKTLYWLTHFPFAQNVEDNIVNNYRYFQEEAQEGGKPLRWKSIGEYRAAIYRALDEYAAAHAALPTYNRAQKLAQMAAVLLEKGSLIVLYKH